MIPTILQSNIGFSINEQKPVFNSNYDLTPNSNSDPSKFSKETKNTFWGINVFFGIIGIILILGGVYQINAKYIRVDGTIKNVNILSTVMNQDQVVKQYPITVSYNYNGEERISQYSYSSVLPPNQGQRIDVYVNESYPAITSLGGHNVIAGLAMVVIGLIIAGAVGFRIYHSKNIIKE